MEGTDTDVWGTLGALSGLAFLSGLRLYSTVLAIGLALRLGILSLPPHLQQLQGLAETPVLAIAGVLYAIEFFADKVPWVDSMWDAVHTIVRPIGAAVLALTAIGEVDPVVKISAALLSGGVALTSHSAKAGTRILVNHSPEPFTNIGLSLAEDAIVAGGVWLALRHPIVTIVLVVLMVAFLVWFVPKVLRALVKRARRIGDFFAGRADQPPASPTAR